MSSHVEYQKFRHGDSCTEEGCRARKFYIEDGRKFCQRGHEQTGFTQTQQDEDDWKSQGKKTRKKREETETSKPILTGNDARELYLQCFQLILWEQCHWLVTVKKLPVELETVVRDLWGLRLSVLSKVMEERGGYSSGTGTQMFSSTSEGEGSDGSGTRSNGSRRTRKSTARQDENERLPKLVETLGLLYLGMLLMRLPVGMGELISWVRTDEMVYSRAITKLPTAMRIRLPQRYAVAFEIHRPLRGDTVNRCILHLVKFFNKEFEMVFPELNTPVLLYKHVRDLSLPVEIYPAVQRLTAILNIDFNFSTSYDSRRSLVAPETTLMSLIIIATKLCQPFDSIKRTPEDHTDPGSISIDWKEWNNIMAESDAHGLRRGEEIDVTDTDVLNMNGQKMDDYMDWFQRMWIEDHDAKMPASILQTFPLANIPPAEPISSDMDKTLDRLKRVHQKMIIQTAKPGSSSNLVRPGEKYRRYRSTEEIPEKGQLFFQRAAKMAGISVQVLVQRTYEMEGRLMKWNLEERRLQSMTGPTIHDDDSDSEE